MPTVSNIVLGETVGDAELGGEFSVAGTLEFIDPEFVPQATGKHKCGWKFTPEDTKDYRMLTGDVEIEVFKHRLTFEENGGFDIPDVYFNDNYTLKNMPITCKNDYRFDGWALDDNNGLLIDFPHVFTDSYTMYAKYMTCTLDKLFLHRGYAELNWQKYWLDRGEPDKAARNLPPDLRYTDDIPEDALGGDIIIPDMHDGEFLIDTFNFSHSNITSIVFNNVMLNMDTFQKTKLKSVIVPNTVEHLKYEVFRGCADLEEIIYEGGESAVEGVYNELGWFLDLKFEYKMRIIEGVSNILLGVPSLKRLEYRNIDNIGSNLWLPIKSITIPNTVEVLGEEALYGCDNLEEVIFEDGSKLRVVADRAFAQCKKLKNIKIPESAVVYASAFDGCEALEEIDITDEQIRGIVRHLHSAYIDNYQDFIYDADADTSEQYTTKGLNDDFEVNIIRGAQYAGINAQGAYVHGEEAINLYIDKFDIYALTVLCHEFFHHFQQVLCYGVGDETWNSVPNNNRVYFGRTSLSHTPPRLIVAKDNWEFFYDWYTEDYHFDPYLIDESKVEEWEQPYIPLNDDESNFDEYWNQPFEADAREFASWFTGVNYG